jgi:hypothetical protein
VWKSSGSKIRRARLKTAMLLDKPIEAIEEADIISLIDAGIAERKTLEYKESLPGYSDDGRKEYLADISSFANAAGGHLIYGMREEDGVPVELTGIDGNVDEEVRRLEGMVRDGIDPMIAGVHSQPIKLANSKTAIVVRIPKSFSSPHMVRFKNTSRFYSRASNGKYQLDVDEIRAAFLGSETTAERIRTFRLDRVSKIRARETAVPMHVGPRTALHIIPLNAFASGIRYDVIELRRNVATTYQALAPLFRDGAQNSRINFDGLLVRDAADSEASTGFLQLYRSGIIETVDGTLIGERQDYGKIIPSLVFEVKLVRFIRRVLPVLKSLGVDPPLAVMLALIDVRDYSMSRKDYLGFPGGSAPFDREILLPREALIDEYSADVSLIMKPLIDEIWNAAGFNESPYYKNGGWVGEELARQYGI